MYKLASNTAFLVSLKAFVVDKDKVLILQNAVKPGKASSEKWGLPGGLLEWDEAIEEGLHREILEETELKVKIGKLLATGNFAYKGFKFEDGSVKDVRIIEIGYLATFEGGEITVSHEHQGYKWVTKGEMKEFDFSQDSTDLVKQFLEANII